MAYYFREFDAEEINTLNIKTNSYQTALYLSVLWCIKTFWSKNKYIVFHIQS